MYVSWCDDKGPFFCGLSYQMPFPSFKINFNSPTSTSRSREVANLFADNDGMVITFNNTGLQSIDRTAFFDASWISKYKEEQEWSVLYVY